jgi:hypothetical protein
VVIKGWREEGLGDEKRYKVTAERKKFCHFTQNGD